MNRPEDAVLFLPGKRVSLCPIRTEDVQLYVKWLNNAGVTDNLGIMRPMTMEREEEALTRMSKAEPDKMIVTGIWLNQPWKLIGNVGLHFINHLHQNAELGIFIGEPSLWGKGYGPEALRLMIDYAFNTLNMRKLTIRYYGHNERGGKAYHKIGFKEVGRFHEHLFIQDTWVDEVFLEMFKDEYLKTAERE